MSCSCNKCEPTKCLPKAGCDEELTKRFSALYSAGQTEDAAKLLKCRRCEIISSIHDLQQQVDLLDYIIHNLKKEKDEQK